MMNCKHTNLKETEIKGFSFKSLLRVLGQHDLNYSRVYLAVTSHLLTVNILQMNLSCLVFGCGIKAISFAFSLFSTVPNEKKRLCFMLC